MKTEKKILDVLNGKPVGRVKIHYADWDVYITTNFDGGRFNSRGPNGYGYIMVGSKHLDCEDVIQSIFMHEVLEAILTMDGRRWKEDTFGAAILFSFDHNYFESLCVKLHDSLKSCDIIDIVRKIRLQEERE